MSFLTLIILALGFFTTLFIFGMILFGVKSRKYMENLGDNLDESNMVLRRDFQEVQKTLKSSKIKQERILKRLENLETIVTSEAWDAIQAGEDEKTIGLHLNDEEENMPDTEEAAQRMAKKIRR